MTAIQEFNAAFGLNALDPVKRDDQPGIITIANRHGRLDISQKLREHFDEQRVRESIAREGIK